MTQNASQNSSTQDLVRRVIEPEEAISLARIQSRLSMNFNVNYADVTVTKALAALVKDGELIKPRVGRYALPSYKPLAFTLGPWVLSQLRTLAHSSGITPRRLKALYKEETSRTLEEEMFVAELDKLAAKDWARKMMRGSGYMVTTQGRTASAPAPDPFGD